MNLSIVIIAFNEEENLPRCLSSLPKGAEIIVLDSGSQDSTVKIAKEFGAKVFFRPFDHYAEQKNQANEYATKEWILNLDADECLDRELKIFLEVSFVSSQRGPRLNRAFPINRYLSFQGKLLRFGNSKSTPIRLFAKGSGKYESAIHEVFTPKVASDLSDKPLPGNIIHYSYKDLEDYFIKFNRYTSIVAQGPGKKPSSVKLKLNIVLRFWWEFILRFIIKLGFLDGYEGYLFCMISSFYVFIKYAKMVEVMDLEAGQKR